MLLSDLYAPIAERWEGRCSWMYLDGANPPNVTIGIGHLIATPDAALALPWDESAVASPADREWWTVRKAAPAQVAMAYRGLTTARLTGAAIDALLRTDITGKVAELRPFIPRFDDMPTVAQLAVLDMGFNLGSGKLRAQFFGAQHEFGPALLAGDYRTAAAQCIRRGIQQERNDWAVAQLRSAAAQLTTA